MIHITDSIVIQDWEIREQFVRASGPGGQNVNKVSTAVELRFEAERSPALTPAVKTRLRRIAGRKWTKEGALIVTAQEHRTQGMNRELAETKLRDMILEALKKPKYRVKTRPTLASKRRRLDAKTQRGAVKAMRGRVTDD